MFCILSNLCWAVLHWVTQIAQGISLKVHLHPRKKRAEASIWFPFFVVVENKWIWTCEPRPRIKQSPQRDETTLTNYCFLSDYIIKEQAGDLTCFIFFQIFALRYRLVVEVYKLARLTVIWICEYSRIGGRQCYLNDPPWQPVMKSPWARRSLEVMSERERDFHQRKQVNMNLC